MYPKSTNTPELLWERACPRWGRPIQHRWWLTYRYRGQARSHSSSGVFVDFGYTYSTCGSWPASDSGGSGTIDVEWTGPIASRLAPTGEIRTPGKARPAGRPPRPPLPLNRPSVSSPAALDPPAPSRPEPLNHTRRASISLASPFCPSLPSLRTSPRISRAPSLSPMSM